MASRWYLLIRFLISDSSVFFNYLIEVDFKFKMSQIIKKIISTPLCPRPVGPYNQAVIIDRMLYLSGVVGLDKDTGKLVPGGVIPETIKTLTNIQKLLEVSGSKIDNVVKCTVLLNDINDFAAVNQEYMKGWNKQSHWLLVIFKVACLFFAVFTTNFPARTCYQAGKLPIGAAIEIEVIAIVGDVKVETVNVDPKL